MDVAFRQAVAQARRQGKFYFASLLSEDLIHQAFGAARATRPHPCRTWRRGEASLDTFRGITLLTPDGRCLVTAAADEHSPSTIRLRELATGKERLRIADQGAVGHECLAVSPDGRILAVARQDRTLQFFDLRTGKEVLRHSGYAESVHRMTFSPDGRFLATGHEEGTILVWALPDRVPRGQDSGVRGKGGMRPPIADL